MAVLGLWAVGAAAFPSAVSAWNANGSDVQQRVSELDKSWSSLNHDGEIADIIQRSRQDRQPDWVGKDSWQTVFEGKRYAFAVGVYRGKAKSEARVNAAESAARGRLGKLFGKKTIGGAMVDWFSDAKGRFYALAATELAEASQAPAVETQAEAAPEPPRRTGEATPAAAGSDDSITIDGYLTKADRAIAARRFEEAQDDLDLAALFLDQTDPRRLRYFERSAGIAVQTRDYPKAKECLHEALKMGPPPNDRQRMEKALKALGQR